MDVATIWGVSAKIIPDKKRKRNPSIQVRKFTYIELSYIIRIHILSSLSFYQFILVYDIIWVFFRSINFIRYNLGVVWSYLAASELVELLDTFILHTNENHLGLYVTN